MDIIRPIVHYGLHFIAPLAIAYIWSRERWRRSYLILLATMVIDLDHLWANPIFDPNRCSVGFHPLHSYIAIFIYMALLLHKKSRLIAIGLLFHIVTDSIDWWLH